KFAIVFSLLITPGASDLPGRDVEAVPDVDVRNHNDQRRKRGFLVVPCGLLPDVIGHRVGAIAEPSDSFRKRQRSAFRFTEVWRVAPRCHGEEAIVRFAFFLRSRACMSTHTLQPLIWL